MRSSAIVLAIGSLTLALGLYLVGFGTNLELTWERNFAACNTAPWCGVPPPGWSFLWVAVPLTSLGALVLTLGIVQVRREQRGRLHLGTVQPHNSP
jgi:hypothetical protein